MSANEETITIALAVLVAIGLWVWLSASNADTFLNPLTAQRESVALDRDTQIQLGQDIQSELEKMYGSSDAEPAIFNVGGRLLQALQQLEQTLSSNRGQDANLSSFPYQFRVLNTTEVINALALPGGSVFITKGLLAQLKTEAQLAAVLGHELSHIALRHAARAYETLMKGSLAIYLLQKLTGQRFQDLYDAAELVDYLLQLQYSRDRETAADHLGFLLACFAGYDPHGMIELFEIFKRLSLSHKPEWESTHPLPESRIEYVSHLSCTPLPSH